LRGLPASGALESLEEALLPAGDPARIPPCVRRPVLRCLDAPVEWHVQAGVITSSELLARVIPQLTGHIGAVGVDDPELRRLYGAIYGAFRRRRSLLLLNLESQVRLSELPWVLAIDSFRQIDDAAQHVARRALEEVVALALTAFPHVILPNKLLQEVRTLLQGAGLQLPIVDEIAADIFMGEFTTKYAAAAVRAHALLAGTLYATYYRLDAADLATFQAEATPPAAGPKTAPAFVALCRARAGEPARSEPGRGFVARNGKVIEQEQVLTTHNLAVLVDGLALRPALEPRAGELARRCFEFVCRSQRALAKAPWESRLRGVKNAAYAWRQLVFFLSLASEADLYATLGRAREHLAQQPADLRTRLEPALEGLERAARGSPPARPFLGWTTEKHWLLA
jgi:hypothetical protein